MSAVEAPAGTDHERLLALVHGFRASQVIHVLAVLGIADRLAAGPATAQQLAAGVSVDAGALARVLRLAAYLGVVEEAPGDRFSLTAVGEGLRSDVPRSMRSGAIMLGAEHYRAWADLLYAVRTGAPAFPHVFGTDMFSYLSQHPDSQAVFDAAMAGNVEMQIGSLADAYDFSAVGVLVDVGGGNGAVAAGVLAAHPGMTAVIEDQPQVLDAAREYLSRRGLLERCRLVPGSFFDFVPEGGDVYVMSHIVHDWSDEAAAKILRNCRAAMKLSSKLLLLEAVVPPHGTPAPVSLFDVNMLVMLGGKERTEEEFRRLLGDAGFTLDAIAPLSDRRSLIEAKPV